MARYRVEIQQWWRGGSSTTLVGCVDAPDYPSARDASLALCGASGWPTDAWADTDGVHEGGYEISTIEIDPFVDRR